jgi:3-phosphoshikimate 1-carboxyvinyltransferase
MTVTIKKGGVLKGNVSVCASKSEAHRLLICAFLSFARTEIICKELSEDIEATADCIRAAGALVNFENGVITVDSSKARDYFENTPITFDCNESGSTLRFIIPVMCALGIDCIFTGRGRLPERTNRPLVEVLSEKGCNFDKEDGLPIRTQGQLASGVYEIPGNISSQYISGLLFALPLLSGDSLIKITGTIESKPYIMITLEALEKFGIRAEFSEERSEILVKGGQKYVSPGKVKVCGDWSNGAFWLAASELTKGNVTCDNLSLPTKQGDSEIINIIGMLKPQGQCVKINASQFPDLVPVISVMAAAGNGKTVVWGAERLKIKESNRIESVVNMINSLGGNAVETEDGIIVEGSGSLKGGVVNAFGDHRIVMSAAVASIICDGDVTIKGAEAVRKSYPTFFDEFELLGGNIERSDT